MKRATLVAPLAAIVLAACSTVTPVEAPPEELHRLITAEGLLQPGDRVRLVTADGAEHKFRVTTVDVGEGFIRGMYEAVPIADVVAVQTHKVAVGRTTALAAGLYIGISTLIFIAIAPALILSGGGS
jgi:hypothetical protein